MRGGRGEKEEGVGRLKHSDGLMVVDPFSLAGLEGERERSDASG